MKNKKNIIIGAILGIIIAVTYTFIIPIIHEKNCKSRVYVDMKENEDVIKKSIVGIMPETETGGLKSRGGYGSGVIFDKVENLAMHEVNEFSTSSLITRTTNDITQMQMAIGMGI